MRRNWYAAGLLLLLILAVYSAGVYVDRSLRALDQELASAYACAEQGAYRQARDTFRETARDAQQSSKLCRHPELLRQIFCFNKRFESQLTYDFTPYA